MCLHNSCQDKMFEHYARSMEDSEFSEYSEGTIVYGNQY